MLRTLPLRALSPPSFIYYDISFRVLGQHYLRRHAVFFSSPLFDVYALAHRASATFLDRYFHGKAQGILFPRHASISAISAAAAHYMLYAFIFALHASYILLLMRKYISAAFAGFTRHARTQNTFASFHAQSFSIDISLSRIHFHFSAIRLHVSAARYAATIIYFLFSFPRYFDYFLYILDTPSLSFHYYHYDISLHCVRMPFIQLSQTYEHSRYYRLHYAFSADEIYGMYALSPKEHSLYTYIFP